jgi:diguanylate cyclase
MKRALLRAAQFAAILAVVGLGAFQIWSGIGDFPREVANFGLVCAGLMGIAAGEFAAGGRAAAPPPDAPDAALKHAMDRVLGGIRSYLEDHLIFKRDLEGIDAGLAGVSDPARAREAISDLRAANRRMETKSAALNAELETARREIVALRQSVDAAERLALIDPLTQVGNRRFFDRTLNADIAACLASGADLCLALADIDHFKSVNDRFGHVVGDRLLKTFAEVLTTGTHGRAKTARYGGEEFVLIMPGVPFPEARRIVEKLRRDLEAKRWVVGPTEQPIGAVTASFGVAKLAPGESAESFFHRADERLIKAKALGRNRVVADDGSPPARVSA